ncbi:MAG: TonB-dependent receptor [Sphingobacteriales bacterium]
MKLTTLVLVIALVEASAAGYSQITLKEKNAPLEKVLKAIEKQTQYVFLYGANDLTTGPITVNVTNATLEQTLAQCFKDYPVDYTIEDHNVLLKPKAPAAADKPTTALIDARGRVIDENGQPLPGATVKTEAGSNATLTDAQGNFLLPKVQPGTILIVTFIGYEALKVKAAADMGIIKLKQVTSKLDEIQVIAYGTTTRRLNTGDVTSVSSKEIGQQPVNSPLLALEGRVPGMVITQSSGLPGGAIKVEIRGRNSIRQGSDPLYIIDGVPYSNATPLNASPLNTLTYGTTENPFSFINPSDIESIDVLKDADATAIYGSRGANGVVLITTKRGKAGQIKVDINLQSGVGQVAHELPLLNTRQYLVMRHEAFKNDGAIPNSSDYDLTLWDTTRNTDWQKKLIGGYSQYRDAHVSISGGNANTQFLFGTSYHKETTVTPGNYNDQKGSLNFNINSKSTDQKFRFSFSGNYSGDANRLGSYNFTAAAILLAPDAPALYKPDGSINWAPDAAGTSTWPSAYSNPIASLLARYNINTNNVIGNSSISYELTPGLQLKSSLGYSNLQVNQFSAEPHAAEDPSIQSLGQSYADFGNSKTQSWIIEPQITYDKNIGKGHLAALAGMTIQENKNADQVIQAKGFSNDLLMEDITAATTLVPGASLNTLYRYSAGFARINYNWEDRYIINLTGRRDGSSRFGPANRFHNFGAVGAAWIFSKAAFLQDRFSWLSFGKLRASYGSTGNDQVGDYSYLDLYSNLTGIGVPYQGAAGIAPKTIYTPDLQWEATQKMEAGIELSFLKDYITINASYYHNRSSNQLISYLLPAITGFTSVQKNLNAVVQNQGWELELTAVNVKTTSFRWSTSFNISQNRNILLSVPKDADPLYQQLAGHSLNSQLVYHFLGVEPITGANTFSDSNGHATTNPNLTTDRTVLIDLTPKFYGGFQNAFSYKGLMLDFLFQFIKQLGQDYKYNYIPGFFNGSVGTNQPITVLDHWQKPGDVSSNQPFSQGPRLVTSYINARSSDQIYGDASYIRLKNLALSWTLPEIWIKKASLQNLRIFLQGQNLLTLTNYKGLDPESQNSANSLPPLRVLTFGIQVIL